MCARLVGGGAKVSGARGLAEQEQLWGSSYPQRDSLNGLGVG